MTSAGGASTTGQECCLKYIQMVKITKILKIFIIAKKNISYGHILRNSSHSYRNTNSLIYTCVRFLFMYNDCIAVLLLCVFIIQLQLNENSIV